MTRFGQCCLLARRLIESGVRFVTINAFLTVFDEITWDIHGSKPFTSIEGMRDIVCPMYDQAYTALVEDLAQRGLLDTTLVCNLAEFGRTPRVNPAGGRDHWPLCFTVGFAGGGVQGRPGGRGQRSRSAPCRRTVPSSRPTSPRRSSTASASTSKPSSPGRPAGRSRWSTSDTARSTNCSESEAAAEAANASPDLARRRVSSGAFSSEVMRLTVRLASVLPWILGFGSAAPAPCGRGRGPVPAGVHAQHPGEPAAADRPGDRSAARSDASVASGDRVVVERPQGRHRRRRRRDPGPRRPGHDHGRSRADRPPRPRSWFDGMSIPFAWSFRNHVEPVLAKHGLQLGRVPRRPGRQRGLPALAPGL